MGEAAKSKTPKGGDLVRRHRLSTRLWHWVNAVALIVMGMSGLMIFNAHPRLYWGEYGANADAAWLQIGATRSGEGMLRIGDARIRTTGVLGVWKDPQGATKRRAFPWWATIPSHYSLADARLWHLAFAWVMGPALLLYVMWSLFNGHIWRDLRMRLSELRPVHIWKDIKDHSRLRFPTGSAALQYNILQKLAYGAVLFVMLPLVVLTGLAMSPGMDAAWPWLSEMWGGRQSARSVHFLCAFGLLGFFLIHIAMVVLAGTFNEVRSMITGNYRLPKERGVEE